MSESKKDKTLIVDSSPEIRGGKHATMTFASTVGGETRLDFIEVDQPSVDPEVESVGVLSARVFMSNANLVALRDMLIKHTSQWGEAESGR